jgi:hypothetical protein
LAASNRSFQPRSAWRAGLGAADFFAAVQAPIEPVAKLACIRTGKLAERLESASQLANRSAARVQLGPFESGDLVELLTQGKRLRLVVLEPGRVGGGLLLALLEHGIAVLAEFRPQALIDLARHRAYCLPLVLKPLDRVDCLAAIVAREQLPGTLDQRLLLLLVAGVLGIQPALQAGGEGRERVLLLFAGVAVHWRAAAPFLFRLLQGSDYGPPVSLLPVIARLKGSQPGEQCIAAPQIFLADERLGGKVFLAWLIRPLGCFPKALLIGF